MTNLDQAGYELREDLRSAARRMLMYEQRRQVRLRRAAAVTVALAVFGVGGTAAAVLLGRTTPTPTQTVTVTTGSSSSSSPPGHSGTGSARTEMSVFARKAVGQSSAPAVVVHALQTYAQNPGQDFGRLEMPVRTLSTSGSAALYAAATSRGYACFAVTDGFSPSGSCAADLTRDNPISAVVAEPGHGEHAIVAGVARDGIARVTAIGATGLVCTVEVVDNGFLCTSGAGSGSTITAYRVSFDNGTITTVPF